MAKNVGSLTVTLSSVAVKEVAAACMLLDLVIAEDIADGHGERIKLAEARDLLTSALRQLETRTQSAHRKMSPPPPKPPKR